MKSYDNRGGGGRSVSRHGYEPLPPELHIIYILNIHVCVYVIAVTAAILYTSEQETVIISRSSRWLFPRRAYMFLRTYTSLAVKRYGTFLYADTIGRIVYNII